MAIIRIKNYNKTLLQLLLLYKHDSFVTFKSSPHVLRRSIQKVAIVLIYINAETLRIITKRRAVPRISFREYA